MKEWSESEIVPISAISHHLYCPRQNALIHTEGVFSDNALTTSGNIGHQFVDVENSFVDHGLRKETAYRVFSEEYGISGIADIIEFPKDKPPLPIDYKNGRISSWENQESQVCAIALCLEEMLSVKIGLGAIYHVQSKRRHEFQLDQALRDKTIRAIQEIRENLVGNIVPKAEYSKRKCDNCSLFDLCLPKLERARKNDFLFKPVDFNG
ncbi:MAG TPA: CRISPR-associated protein Cas4 [Leptospiraceae bacterium]|nr:CRISPR-associated protein Cas4 [Leptospiraceae bacterium]HMW08683.1 CRISPR-associated protein Cas4 [Leptospiraceae bacterium]HMX34936.1 CRISPR-associated protein Cas4 [Leptospiraceae bacterium]HMY34396.1 CRISPR-associated protein Cas4 [Leptospiraceae bacterium]HMZ67201.1 CRISPR-associated protein Cas4 [Leptospiraceae bacterium]